MPRSTVTLPVGNWIRERRAATCPRPGRPAKRWGIVTLALLAGVPCPHLPWPRRCRLAAEFQVNSYTTGEQGGYYDRLRVASDSAGNFVVVWDEAPPRSGRKPGSSVAPACHCGPEFLIDQGAVPRRWPRTLRATFVVAYVPATARARRRYVRPSVRQRGRSPAGRASVVETGLVSYSWNPKVASDAAGNFVVVWPGDSVGDR